MTFTPPTSVRPLTVGAAFCAEFECLAPEDWNVATVVGSLWDDYGIGRVEKLTDLGTFEGCRKWHVRRG